MEQPKAFPQIKVCGLTDPDEAAACAALGADAIGLVFHPPSPRYVTVRQAARIAAALPQGVPAVGVFVDPTWEAVSEAVAQCRLGAVQLHGAEPRAFIDRLRGTHAVRVIKVLFAARVPRLEDAGRYSVAAYLVECGRGVRPGGNALTWEWGVAAEFAQVYPTVLAGGLDPENVARAIGAALPDAVDASSGLEAGPGRKDLDKVARFVAAVRQTAPLYSARSRKLNPIFRVC